MRILQQCVYNRISVFSYDQQIFAKQRSAVLEEEASASGAITFPMHSGKPSCHVAQHNVVSVMKWRYYKTHFTLRGRGYTYEIN